MSLAREFVRTLSRLNDAPEPVVARTRLHVADSVGIALAARGDAATVAALLGVWGRGSGPAGVLGGGPALPAPAAAFVNAALAHVLDYDDIHDPARLHPTTVCFPAALAAAAEAAGDDARVDDARIVQATALGNEAMCRLGLACSPGGTGPGADWFLTQLFGTLGGALAAGHVLGLDEDGLVSALGFAYMQAAGGKEPGFGTGSTSRSIYPAFAAMAGVTAALLSRAGLGGPQGSLDGAAGLLRIYLGLEPTEAVRRLLLDPQRRHAMDVSFKPWPCCRLSHPYVAAALALREQVRPGDIRRLVIGVNASAEKLCRPLPQRVRPRTLQDAKYSVPFMTAFALVHGEVSLRTLDARALDDEAVLALAQRVELRPGLPDRPGHPPARLEAWTDAARPAESAADAVPDMDEDAVWRKFLDCTTCAGRDDGAALWSAIAGGAGGDQALQGLARPTMRSLD